MPWRWASAWSATRMTCGRCGIACKPPRATWAAATRRVFADAPHGSHYYAFKTALDACDTTRSRPPRVPITLDCPITSDVDLFAWLELCRRRLLGVPVLPTFVWREATAPRLLVSLGPAQGSMLKYLVRPEDQATQRWSLLTARSDAIEACTA